MNEKLNLCLSKSGPLSRLYALLLRLGYLYAMQLVLRFVFVLYNAQTFGDFTLAELPGLIQGSLVFDTANIGYCFFLFLVLSVVPVSRKISEMRWYRMVLLVLFMVGVVAIITMTIADTIYFYYAKKRITIDEMHFAGNDNNMAVMWYSILENWYLILLAVGLGWLSFRAFCRTALKPVFTRLSPLVYYPLYSVFTFLVILYIVIGMRGGFGRDVRPITPLNAVSYTQSAVKAAVVQSNPFSFLRTMSKQEVPTPVYMPQAVADSIFDNTVAPIGVVRDSLFGSQRGKNVVIIVLESFSAEHSDVLYPGAHAPHRFTPVLDSLMRISHTFTRAYANGQKSIEALPSILASVPALNIRLTSHSSSLSINGGIGTSLKEEGYRTSFYNGSPAGSMGFDAMARIAGFDTARSMDHYTKLHGRAQYDGMWGIWDEPFLQYYAEELAKAQQPFASALFTLSSHHPFKVPEKYQDILPKDHTKIHQPVAYTDHAIGQFLRTAAQGEWYQNTLFVFVADHTSGELKQDYYRTPIGLNHIVYFIHAPDGSLQKMDSTITQQIDIPPTLRHLLGIEEPKFGFGRNVFDTLSGPFSISANGGRFQWITQDTIYHKSIQELNENAGCKVQGDELDRLRAFVQNYGARINSVNLSLGNTSPQE